MTEGVTIVLAGLPRGKERPRFRQGQRRPFTPKQTRSYEHDLGWAARNAMKGRAPFEGPIEIDVSIAFPIPASWPSARRRAALGGVVRAMRKPDADNVLKAIADALNAICFNDDVQITDIRLRKRYGMSPGVAIVVRPLEAEAAQWAA